MVGGAAHRWESGLPPDERPSATAAPRSGDQAAGEPSAEAARVGQDSERECETLRIPPCLNSSPKATEPQPKPAHEKDTEHDPASVTGMNVSFLNFKHRSAGGFFSITGEPAVDVSEPDPSQNSESLQECNLLPSARQSATQQSRGKMAWNDTAVGLDLATVCRSAGAAVPS
jgi:hypothetical protein